VDSPIRLRVGTDACAPGGGHDGHVDTEDVMATGTVKWFSDVNGWGFIAPDAGDGDVFVQCSGIAGIGPRTLWAGERVEFDVVERRRGREAIDVAPLQRALLPA
jgi:CspA family cold shock protein